MCFAIPGKIIEIYQRDNLRMARIDFGGVIKEICMAYIPEAKIGKYTLIHVGFAISLMDEEEAQETLKLIKDVAEFENEA